MSLQFLIILLVLASDSFSLHMNHKEISSTLREKNLGKLNGAHLKFAVTHVSS